MDKFKDKILELRKLGKTYKEISHELNCAFSTISYHCKINKLGGHSDRLDDDEKIKLQELYDEIGNGKKVAKLTGHAYETVRKYITLRGKEKKVSKSESVIEWRKRTKIKLVDYKGGRCQMCGYNKSIAALHFHHLDPNEKDFSISGKSLSFDKLKNEVDKCILVCSNCHSEIHEGLIKL